ncbi:MAG: hypothetical protein WDZ31_06395 [Phycisphaeraceae bacterium]
MLKRLTLVVPMLLTTVAMPALAQEEVSPAPDTQRWVPIILAVLLILLVGMASFWSSRRGHQD